MGPAWFLMCAVLIGLSNRFGLVYGSHIIYKYVYIYIYVLHIVRGVDKGI